MYVSFDRTMYFGESKLGVCHIVSTLCFKSDIGGNVFLII